MKPLVVSAAIAGICALVSIVVLIWTSQTFFLAGSTPATIWGPDIGPLAVKLLVAATVLAVALVRGRVRAGVLLVWLVTLAVLTHRVVDVGPDGMQDVWFGVTVHNHPAWRETDPEPRPCSTGPLAMLCTTRAGVAHGIVTVVRFTRLDEAGGKLTPVR